MKTRSLPLVLCGAVLLTSVASHAKDKPLEVSKDNFVSLSWSRSGGFAGISERYTIQNHEVIRNTQERRFGGQTGSSASFAPSSLPQVVPLSENQWNELLAQLKKAQVPAIAGTYKQEQLADGFNETLQLTLSDSENRDQTFTVSNYGDRAPASYSRFTAYLTPLLERKFRPSSQAASAPQNKPAPPAK